MTYLDYLKKSARMAFPMKHDFDGVWTALSRVAELSAVVASRLLILVTLPISVPLMAFMWMRVEKRREVMREARKKELIESMMSMAQKNGGEA